MKAFLVAVLLLLASQASAQTLRLDWQDNSTNEDGFRIERGSTQTGPFTLLNSVGANVVVFMDTGLQQATQYCYRLKAFNVTGESPPSNVACAMTKAMLAVIKAGTGAGTVSSTPAGMNCGAVCEAWFDGNSNVTLNAVAASGSVFAGWGGACSGTGPCTVLMSAAKSVTANFNAITPPPPPSNLTIQLGVQ